MKYRLFGKTGQKISVLGYGTWGMGNLWGPRDDRGALDALSLGLELGIDFIDTAAVYGEGHSEELVGVTLKKTRRPIFVATKIPPKNRQWPPSQSLPLREAFTKNYIISETEKSLKRLRREIIDLQQLHVWDASWLNDLEWLEAFSQLKQQGKIRFFGVSVNDHQPESVLELVASGFIDSVQVIYNIFDQSAETKLFPLCLEKNIGVIVRVPFDEGSLGGKLTPDFIFHKKDWRKNYFTKERLPEVCTRVQALEPLLKKYEIPSLSDLALRFCLAHPAVSTVIAGMRNLNHVRENVAASQQNELPQNLLEELRHHMWSRNFYQPHQP